MRVCDLLTFGDLEYATETIAEQGAQITRLQQDNAKISAKHRMYERMWIKERRANIALRSLVRDYQALVDCMTKDGAQVDATELAERARMLGAIGKERT